MVLAKRTLMFFNPKATKIVPVAQHSAAVRAISRPLRLTLPRSFLSSNEIKAMLSIVRTVPIRYLTWKGSLRKRTAKIIVKSGDV